MRSIASEVMKSGVGVLFGDGKGFSERRCRACSSGCAGGGLGGKEVQARLTNHSTGRWQYMVIALVIFFPTARNVHMMSILHIHSPSKD